MLRSILFLVPPLRGHSIQVFTPRAAAVLVVVGGGLLYYFNQEKKKLEEEKRMLHVNPLLTLSLISP